ncbi:MAG: hypothetical protein AB2610_04085, partial [Candidatus Thiodiazotropha sp.]
MKTTHTLLAGGLLISIGVAFPIAGTMAQGGYMPYGYGQGYAPPSPYQMPVMPPHPAYGGYGGAPGYGPYRQPFGGYYAPPPKYRKAPQPNERGTPAMQGMSGMEGMPGMDGTPGPQG